MKCKNCGKDLIQGQNLCYSCGTMNELENTKASSENNKTKLIFMIVLAILTIVGIVLIVLSNKEDKPNSDSGSSNDIEVSQNKETTTAKIKHKDISIGEKVKTDEAEFTIENIELTNKVEPPKKSGYYRYYEAEEGQIYVDMVIEYKNLTSSSIEADEVVSSAILKYQDKYEYKGFSTIEEDNRSDFTYTNITSIDPLTTEYLHYLFAIPEEASSSDGKIDVYFTLASEDYRVSGREGSVSKDESTSTKKEKNKEIALNEIQKVEGVGEFKILSSDITKKVEPPKKSGYYSYYSAEEGKTYIDICIQYKNLSNDNIEADEIINGAKLYYNEKYEYTGFTIIEEDNRSDFTYANITSVAPLTTEYLHYLVSVPEEVGNDNLPIKFNFGIGNNTYIYNLR